MIILGIVLFVLLVIIHEYGHFIAARRSGVTVEEFGFGFPPRLLGKKFGKAKTLYSLNLIPLGGFVKLKGESDQDKRPRSFGAARFKNKAKILAAGVGMNILAAMVLITVLAWFGLPKLVPGQYNLPFDQHAQKQRVIVAAVEPGSPADKIGLKTGDQIIKVGDQAVSTGSALSHYTHAHPLSQVMIVYENNGQKISKITTLEKAAYGQGQIGIVPFDDATVRYTWAAPIEGIVLTLQLVWLTVAGLVGLLAGLFTRGTAAPAVQSVAGPVGVFALLQTAAQLGVRYVVFLIVTISVSLAVINILPLPALDGGRLALIAIFKALKKPLNQKLETAIHATGFVVILALAVLITIFDVHRFY